jgi:hypothetical protein
VSKPDRPLPLEARRVLWTRIWNRLLAEPVEPMSPPPTRDGRPTDPLAAPDEEGQP